MMMGISSAKTPKLMSLDRKEKSAEKILQGQDTMLPKKNK
jgi:hypothetical protein